jgi:hypothetical protein
MPICVSCNAQYITNKRHICTLQSHGEYNEGIHKRTTFTFGKFKNNTIWQCVESDDHRTHGYLHWMAGKDFKRTTIESVHAWTEQHVRYLIRQGLDNAARRWKGVRVALATALERYDAAGKPTPRPREGLGWTDNQAEQNVFEAADENENRRRAAEGLAAHNPPMTTEDALDVLNDL